MPARQSAWLHRTARGSYVGDADGSPTGRGPLGRALDALWMHRHTLAVFAGSRFRAAHRAQLLGLLWPIAYPTVLMIVMSVVFGVVFRTEIEGYPVLVLLGLVPWHFLSHAWTSGMHSLLAHAAIVKRTAVPPWVIVTGTVLSDLYNLGFSALSILPLIAVYPEVFRVSLALFWIPAILLCLVAFALGLALASSVLNVAFRDTGYVVDSILIAFFWATPIIYPMDRVPGVGHTLMHLNPMATLVESIRVVVMRGESPPPTVLGAAVLGSLAVLGGGLLAHRLLAPGVSDHV
ncbi:MAG TPA: ABC transporter permease [Sandaracinaceae bacterium LLY-WYZ-13_1]|nr:ABC transporter permease [Sandaracinaceae bacterium LLY-WYZ-13_1]